jgi:uncharacterized membrane protein
MTGAPMDTEAAALCALARHAGVDLDPRDVAIELRSQPSYPSILAVSHTLDELGIRHVPAAVTLEALARVAPAIVSTDEGFLLVESAGQAAVTVVDPARGRRTIEARAFEAAWGGAALFLAGGVRITHSRRELERARRGRARGRGALAGLALAWLGCLVAVGGGRGALLALLGLNLVALAAAATLAGLDLGVETRLAQALCPTSISLNPNISILEYKHIKISSYTDVRGGGCRAVLRSRLARPFGLSLAEIGLCALAGQQLALAWALAGPVALATAVAAACLPAIPFAALALLYQGLVVRAWCRLCIVVQAALLAQAAVALAWFDPAAVTATRGGTLLLFAAALAAPAALWLAVRPWLAWWARRADLLAELRRLRRAPARVADLLASAPPLELGELAGDILRGPAGAPVQLDVVTSLECGACRTAFLELDDLLGRFDNLRARLRFAAAPRARKARQAGERAIALALRGDHDQAWQLLTAYFRAPKLGGPGPTEPRDLEDAARALDTQAAWCEAREIRVAPIRGLNGRLLDPGCSIRDLAGFLAAC